MDTRAVILQPAQVLAQLEPEFVPDCADFGREFSRHCFNLRNLLPLVPSGGSVLDVGAGAGVMAAALKACGAQVTVVDSWRPYTAEAAASGERFMHRMGSREKILGRFGRMGIPAHELDITGQPLPFPDGSFDMVMLLAVIEHLSGSPRRVLEEARRVLKPGGVMVIEAPNIAALRNRVKLLRGRSIHFAVDDWYRSEPFLGHYRELTRAELGQYAEWLGLEPLWLRTSNTAFHNTRRADGRYDRGFRLTSAFQWCKAAYLLLCLPFPGLRYQILLAARKPN